MEGIDWGQCPPYNQMCPSIGSCDPACSLNDSLCVLGCVASSLSRLLRYHAYPDAGTGSSCYWWPGEADTACVGLPGDTLCANYTWPIDWDMLPESCVGGCSGAEEDSLASLCYRVAVGVEMQFGHYGSDTDFVKVPPLLEDHLGYRCDPWFYWYEDDTPFEKLRTEVCAHRPVHGDWDGVHSVCFDGWAIDNAGHRWIHKNDDASDNWWIDSTWVSGGFYPGIRPLGAVDSVLVKADGSGDPYHTIQGAVDSVSTGCCIYLDDGTYTGSGNRDIDFGGKAVTIRSLSDDPDACIIDCEGSAQDPHRGFYLHSGERGDAVVRGITVTNGYVAGGGGAVLVTYPTTCSEPSTPLFINCVFRGNEASCGGAVAAIDCARPRLEWCVLADNTAGQGSAFYASSDYCSLVNCTIADNTCGTSSQGAVCTDGGQGLLLDRCLVTGTNVGVSTTCLNGGEATYSRSDIWGNQAGTGDWNFRGSCILSQQYADSNLCVDPEYCGSAYELTWGSPCRDYGGDPVGAREECDWVSVPGDFSSIRDAIDEIDFGSPKTIVLTDSVYSNAGGGDPNQNLEITDAGVTIRSQSGDPGSCRIVLSGQADHRFASIDPARGLALYGVTIEGGSCNGSPGGTVRVFGTAVLTDCVIDSSRAYDGGAFAVEVGGNLTLAGCRIQRCDGYTGGAGVVRGTLEADSTLFWANYGHKVLSQYPYAGGIFVEAQATADLIRCTFAANGTTGPPPMASAMYVGAAAVVAIDRSILAYGTGGAVPAVDGCAIGDEVIASCTDVFGNGRNWYACLADQDTVSTNLTANPGFCDASAGDFHSDSLYICCGDCGQIGAYDSVCVVSKMAIPRRAKPFLELAGRNPSHAPALRFSAGEGARGVRVDVSLYDVTGRRVRQLFGGLGAGAPQIVVWDGAGDAGQRLPSGVYFARMTVDGVPSKVQRLVVLH